MFIFYIHTPWRKPFQVAEQNSISILNSDTFTEAKAAREAGWQAVLVDRSLEQEGSIDIDDETRQNFQVIESLHDLFDDDDLEQYEEVCMYSDS